MIRFRLLPLLLIPVTLSSAVGLPFGVEGVAPVSSAAFARETLALRTASDIGGQPGVLSQLIAERESLLRRYRIPGIAAEQVSLNQYPTPKHLVRLISHTALRRAIERLPDIFKMPLPGGEETALIYTRQVLDVRKSAYYPNGATFQTLLAKDARSGRTVMLMMLHLLDYVPFPGADFEKDMRRALFEPWQALQDWQSDNRPVDGALARSIRQLQTRMNVVPKKVTDLIPTRDHMGEFAVFHEIGEALIASILPLSLVWQWDHLRQSRPGADSHPGFLRHNLTHADDPVSVARDTFADQFALWLLDEQTRHLFSVRGWSLTPDEILFFGHVMEHLHEKVASGRHVFEPQTLTPKPASGAMRISRRPGDVFQEWSDCCPRSTHLIFSVLGRIAHGGSYASLRGVVESIRQQLLGLTAEERHYVLERDPRVRTRVARVASTLALNPPVILLQGPLSSLQSAIEPARQDMTRLPRIPGTDIRLRIFGRAPILPQVLEQLAAAFADIAETSSEQYEQILRHVTLIELDTRKKVLKSLPNSFGSLYTHWWKDWTRLNWILFILDRSILMEFQNQYDLYVFTHRGDLDWEIPKTHRDPTEQLFSPHFYLQESYITLEQLYFLQNYSLPSSQDWKVLTRFVQADVSRLLPRLTVLLQFQSKLSPTGVKLLHSLTRRFNAYLRRSADDAPPSDTRPIKTAP